MKFAALAYNLKVHEETITVVHFLKVPSFVIVGYCLIFEVCTSFMWMPFLSLWYINSMKVKWSCKISSPTYDVAGDLIRYVFHFITLTFSDEWNAFDTPINKSSVAILLKPAK